MPSTILDGHLHTIALSQAGHARVLREVMKGNTHRARLALTHRIEGVLEEVATADYPQSVGLGPVVVAAANAANSMPGPILRSRIEAVIEALIPE